MASRAIQPAMRPITGTLRPPGSRSLTNRALIVAALADGTSDLASVGLSEDTLVLLEALRTLGIAVAVDKARRSMHITGCAGRVPPGVAPAKRGFALAKPGFKEINTGDSGTATRFMTAFLAAGRGRYRIDGSPRMRERPIQDLLDGLAALGIKAESEAGNGCPPLRLETQGLAAGTVTVSGAVSSQYLSGLLMAAPAAAGPITIRVAGDLPTGQAGLVSKPYADMTLAVMRDFGVEVRRDGYTRFDVPAPALYRACTYAVEPDASSASYFLAAAAVTGGRVTVEGLSRSSLQGDVRFADVLRDMGCSVEWSDRGVTVTGPDRLRAVRIDMNAMPDMVLTLAPIAILARGRTVIENVANLRLKESDRLAALATELARLGAKVKEMPDGLAIDPPETVRPAEIRTYHDHRMAMGMAIVGLRVPGIRIADAECIAKTYPEFFEDLERLVGRSNAD